MAKVDTEKLNELTGHIMSSDKLAAQNDKRRSGCNYTAQPVPT